MKEMFELFSLKSFIGGITHIKLPYIEPKPKWGTKLTTPGKFWFHLWTPVWHKGRGPYISIGLGFIGIYRGY